MAPLLQALQTHFREESEGECRVSYIQYIQASLLQASVVSSDYFDPKVALSYSTEQSTQSGPSRRTLRLRLFDWTLITDVDVIVYRARQHTAWR